MPVELSLVETVPAEATSVGAPVCSDRMEGDGLDWDYLRRRGFEGKPGQVQALPNGAGPITIALGLGESAKVDAAALRKAAAAFVKAVRKEERVALRLLDARGPSVGMRAAAQAIAEGAVLGAYEYLPYKSDPKPQALGHVAIVGGPGGGAAEAVQLGARVAAAACWARDLVNRPGGELTPAALAREAHEMAEREGLACKILKRRDIEKKGLGGLLGVNRGSDNPPRFIKLRYSPEAGRPVEGSLALVGKGITFDSGGLSIKTQAGMATMKCDMAGAAAAIAAMSVLPALAPPVKVTAYVAATDNMLGGDATRPGDVLKLRNGKTIEVLNTDAEGRLVLADALSLASEAKPDAIVDLATLTGACVMALGPKIAGVMGNDDALLAQIEAAAAATGEQVWRLPLPGEYRKMVDSPVADMKNIGGPSAGALTAGIILSEFVGEGIPWAHLDIAGPAFTDNDDGEWAKGGTGFGVRLLTELVSRFAPPQRAAAS
ncbi:MAG: leucyl aminopeptidase [Acidimicrobiales bacterium]